MKKNNKRKYDGSVKSQQNFFAGWRERRKQRKTPMYRQWLSDFYRFRGCGCSNSLCDGIGELRCTDVHHVDYPEGWNLWDFPLDSPLVQILCRKCHQQATLNQALEHRNYRLARKIKQQMAREQLWLRFALSNLDEAA